MVAARIVRLANRPLGLAALLGILLAACTSTPDSRLVSLPVAQVAAQADQTPAAQREHARILTTKRTCKV